MVRGRPVGGPIGSEVRVRRNQARVLELRLAGMTLRQIADEMGWKSESTAKRALDSAMRATIQPGADELRLVMRQRLELLLAKVWSQVMDAAPNSTGYLWAVDRLLSIMERQAKLDGLDSPAKFATDTSIRVELVGVDVDALRGQPQIIDLAAVPALEGPVDADA